MKFFAAAKSEVKFAYCAVRHNLVKKSPFTSNAIKLRKIYVTLSEDEGSLTEILHFVQNDIR